MELSLQQLAYLKAQTLVGTLAEAGVKYFCLSPGFRNSVFVLALQQLKKKNSQIEIFSHLDERGAAYFALGLAKNNNAPAAVICTSGTALANYHPAVLEASYSHTPLVIVSADRPSELIEVGANQSMKQQGIFSQSIRFETHLESNAQIEHVEYQTVKAVHFSSGTLPGPVHINIAFAEPFLPTAEELIGLPPFNKKITFSNPDITFSKESFETVLQKLNKAQRPLLVLGPTPLSDEELTLFEKMATQLKAPLFAEKSSGAPFQIDQCLCHFDSFLKKETDSNLFPDLVFRIGAPPTSKFLNQWLEKSKCPQIILDVVGAGRNLSYSESLFIYGNRQKWLQDLREQIQTQTQASWLQQFIELEKETKRKLASYLEDQSSFTEWKLHHDLVKNLPDHCQLFLGNSMVIRDFESCAQTLKKEISIFCNRGLSGIDGILSTALGVAMSAPLNPTLLLIGDISTLHDISALSLMNRLPKDLPFTIGIINNGGGEIFKIVKTADHPKLENLFTTPQNVDFEKLAQAFSLPFERRQNLKHFKLSQTPTIVEFAIEQKNNTQTRKDFWKRIQK